MDISSFAKIQHERIRFVYHAVRNIWPIWFYLLNADARRIWKKEGRGKGITEESTRIVSSLTKDGIAISHLETLFSGENHLPELMKETEERKKRGESSGSSMQDSGDQMKKGYDKHFMRYFWGGGGTNPVFEAGSAFMHLTLDTRILRIVGSYFGLAPKLHGFSLQETVLVPFGSPAYLSQRWHRDPDDKKICKMFIYLNDVVDEGGGPFMYVKGSQLGGKWRGLFPQRPPVGRYPNPGEVEKNIPKEDIQVCTGKAGTIVLCDTSGLHRGGYSTAATRTMFAAGFATSASIQPRNYRLNPTENLTDISSLARYALR